MKKLLFIVVITIIGLGNLNAQERGRGEFEVAPFVGYSSSFLNGDNVNTNDIRTAAKFGINVDYYFNDRWSLRSGLVFDSMGAKNSLSELELNYLNIPLNANWHFGKTRKWNLNFGVTPGFNTSAKIDGTDVKDNVESFQLGISYGIGYKLEVADNFSILFDLQSMVAVTNMVKQGNISQMNAGSGLNIGGVFSF